MLCEEQRNLDAIRAKNEWWTANHEVHDHQVGGPYPHADDRFAMHFTYDITPSDAPAKGQRFTMTEVGVYTVDNGKIVREEFFYDCPMRDKA